jgi:hypothetical protein
MDDKQEFNLLQKLWFAQIGNMDITMSLAQCEDKSNESKCPICIGDIINETVTKCNHSFCKSCIDKWLETNNTCPSCRAILIISPTNQSEIDDVQHLNTFMGGGGGGLMQLVSYGAQDQYLIATSRTRTMTTPRTMTKREKYRGDINRNIMSKRNIMIQKKY